MSVNRPTPGQILGAANIELSRALKLLIAARNREYRQTGTFSETRAAAISIIHFVRYDLMAGLVSPAEARKPAATEAAARPPGSTRIH